MHWHCELNTPPHLQESNCDLLQDTFYIAMNSAILAMKNKKEHKQSPPSSHMCFIHVLSSQVAPISPDAGVRDMIGLRGKGSEPVFLPFGLWRCLQSSANNPLTFLSQTVKPVLTLRQHRRKTGPNEREHGHWVPTGDWIFQLTFSYLSVSSQPLPWRRCSWRPHPD